MRRISSLFLAACMCVALVGCGAPEASTEGTEPADESSEAADGVDADSGDEKTDDSAAKAE